MSNETELERRLLVAVERLGRALRAGRQQAATRHGLSQLGVSALEALTKSNARRVGDLAAELDISQPTASDALATLEKRELICRHRDPDDLRSTLIALTEAGNNLAIEIADELAPLLSAQTGSADERGTALRLLLGEIKRLQSAGVITVNRSCLACGHYLLPRVPTSGHCLLLDTEITDRELRVDCPQHEPTSLARP